MLAHPLKAYGYHLQVDGGEEESTRTSKALAIDGITQSCEVND